MDFNQYFKDEKRKLLTEEEWDFLDSQGISISAGYIGMIRACKGSELIKVFCFNPPGGTRPFGELLSEIDQGNKQLLKEWVKELMSI